MLDRTLDECEVRLQWNWKNRVRDCSSRSKFQCSTTSIALLSGLRYSIVAIEWMFLDLQKSLGERAYVPHVILRVVPTRSSPNFWHFQQCVKLWQLVLLAVKTRLPPPINSCHMDLNSDFPVFIRACTFFAVIINLDDVGVHGSKYLVVLLISCFACSSPIHVKLNSSRWQTVPIWIQVRFSLFVERSWEYIIPFIQVRPTHQYFQIFSVRIAFEMQVFLVAASEV